MSTLELLIAFSILTLSLSTLVMGVFGDQSSVLDTRLSAAALQVAETILKEEELLAQQDFKLANPTSTPIIQDGYEFSAAVALSALGFSTKQATSSVNWVSGGVAHNVELSTLLTDLSSGNDTCDSIVVGDWSTLPAPLPGVTLTSFAGVPLGVYSISDVDAYRGRLYVTATKTTSATDPTLFVFDISPSGTLSLVGKVDNAASTRDGLAAVRVALDPASGNTYAYVASAHPASWTTCATGPSCSELQVIDVTNPGAMSPSSITSYKLPGVGGSTAAGNALFYTNHTVYVGLTSPGLGNGPGFHEVSVISPTSPSYVGNYDLGQHDVNAIHVHGGYAYIASPLNEEAIILRLSDLSYRSGFNAPVGGGNGKAVYVVGNTLYVGKTTNAGAEYYRLDAGDPDNIQSNNPTPVKRDVGSSLNALIARDYLTFLLTNTELQIINATSTALVASHALAVSGSSYEPSLDCEGNVLYIASNDAAHNGSLSVVSPP